MKLRFLEKSDGKKILQYSEGEAMPWKDVPCVEEVCMITKLHRARASLSHKTRAYMINPVDFEILKAETINNPHFKTLLFASTVEFLGVPVLKNERTPSGTVQILTEV
jgi:hypothetical protein